MDKKEELRQKLRNKINQKKSLRAIKDIKEQNIFDDNLKKLGISNMDELKIYMESIKDIDKTELIESLKKMGLLPEQIKNFFNTFKK